MRRALYRSAWLLIVCILVLGLSLPSMGGVSLSGDVQPLAASVDTGDTSCTTATPRSSGLPGLQSLLGELAPSTNCASAPVSVLIAREHLARAGSAGAPAAATESISANIN